MSNMCKFRVQDAVRIIDPRDTRFDQAGLIIAHDAEYHYAYDVQFADGSSIYYSAAGLTLAPGENE